MALRFEKAFSVREEILPFVYRWRRENGFARKTPKKTGDDAASASSTAPHYGTKPGQPSIIHFPTSERTSEWPSTYVSILVCSRPQCAGLKRGVGVSDTA